MGFGVGLQMPSLVSRGGVGDWEVRRGALGGVEGRRLGRE